MRKKILQAANECFDELGVKKSTLALLAERAGVDTKDIKTLFGNKSLLALAVQGIAIEKMQREYLAKMPDATLVETVKFIIRTRLEFVERHFEQTALFFQNGLIGREPWSTGLDKTIWRLSIEFATLFEKASRRGEIRKDININVAVRAITSFYLTGVVTIGLRAEKFDADTVWAFVEPQIELVIDCLKP